MKISKKKKQAAIFGRTLGYLVCEMARELLIEKATSSVSVTYRHDYTPRCRRTRSSSSSKAQRQYFVADRTSDDDFRTYRKFSADGGGLTGGQCQEGIVMSLFRRCRSRSNSRRRRQSDDDDDNDIAEHIELSQFSGFPLTRLADISDAGHKFVTVYVDVPVWCDKCGQLIIGVYGHYTLCQCEYFRKKPGAAHYDNDNCSSSSAIYCYLCRLKVDR